MWCIAYSEAGHGKYDSTGIPATGADAKHPPAAAFERFAIWQQERDRQNRPAGPGDPAAVKVIDILDDYVAGQRGRVTANERLTLAVRPLRYFFARDTMKTLTPVRVREYEAWRRNHAIRVVNPKTGEIEIVERPIKDGTMIRELGGVLSPAIRFAVKETRRLAQGEYFIPRPPMPEGRDRWLTTSEAALLLWESRRNSRTRLYLPLFILVGLYTGQRRSAILDLQWTQIDFINSKIDFNPPGRRQTKKHRPIVRVPRQLMAALRRAHSRSSSPYVISYLGDKVDHNNITFAFGTAATRAGFDDVTPHVMRHTAGTWMAQRGVPLFHIAGYLGHSVATTTERYAHHHPDHQAEAVAALERRRKPAPTAQRKVG
jgi:integrase